MTYTILVTGSRDYSHTYTVENILTQEARSHNWDIFVRVGDCPTGVDAAVAKWCNACLDESKYKIYTADWVRYGKPAGPKRNHKMVDDGADICIAWPLANSRGTKDCAGYAFSKDIPVWFPDLPDWAQWALPIAQFKGL
jgi:hypothetical protein